MIHKMHLDNQPFEKIKCGQKDIELRLNDEKRQLIKKDDFIIVDNRETNEVMKLQVIDKYIYKSFEEIYRNIDKIRFGYNKDESADPKDMEQYYSSDDILKYGVVGIQVKVIE